jgi:hypothetical protein
VLVGSFASGQNVDCIDREKRMNKLRGLLIGIMLLGISHPALADPFDFEAGTLGDWTAKGLVSVTGTVFLPETPYVPNVVAPFHGNYQVQIASGDITGAVPDVSATELENFFGMPGGYWENQNFARGSGMYRDFQLNVGETVRFNWNFIAGDVCGTPCYDDAAVFVMNQAGEVLSSVALVGGSPDPNSPECQSENPPAGQCGESGWQEHVFPALGVQTAGIYRLGVAVLDNEPPNPDFGCPGGETTEPGCEPFNPSYLLVDNFRVVPTDQLPTPVPEPSTLFLLTGGLGAVIAARGRRAR